MEMKNISPRVAAAFMGKSVQFVRCGLRAGKLPFGTATRVTGKNYSYHISPKLFMDYMRCTLEDIENFLRRSD